MQLQVLDGEFSICKARDASCVLWADDFCFVSQTDEELSVVCRTSSVPRNAYARNDGWRAFRIVGVLDFSLTGVLSGLSGPLAAQGIGIFAVSTYNTDYILIKSENLTGAVQALTEAGFCFISPA